MRSTVAHWFALCLLAALSTATGLVAQTPRAAASTQKDGVYSEDFYSIYDYDTPQRGWFEPNLWMTLIPESRNAYESTGYRWGREDMNAYSAEVEYGVTDRLSVSGYIDLENAHGLVGTHSPGTGLFLTQTRFEARYRFSQPRRHFFDTAAYAEYHFPTKRYSSSQELELRVILEKNIKDIRLDLNPTVSVSTTGSDAGKAPTLNFNTGAYYHRYATIQPGIEYYSGYGALNNISPVQEQQQVMFVTTDLNMRHGWTYQIGVGFGLTRQSDQTTLKTILTYEFNGFGSRRTSGTL